MPMRLLPFAGALLDGLGRQGLLAEGCWDGGHPEDRCHGPMNGRHGRPLVCTPLAFRYDYVTVITSNVTVTITLRSDGRDYLL